MVVCMSCIPIGVCRYMGTFTYTYAHAHKHTHTHAPTVTTVLRIFDFHISTRRLHQQPCLPRRVEQDTYLGLARTIYIRCKYGIFGREITKYTVIYGVIIQF